MLWVLDKRFLAVAVLPVADRAVCAFSRSTRPLLGDEVVCPLEDETASSSSFSISLEDGGFEWRSLLCPAGFDISVDSTICSFNLTMLISPVKAQDYGNRVYYITVKHCAGIGVSRSF